MIFLGAGASKAFGIKTLQEMSKDLIIQVKENGYGDIVDQITACLQQHNITIDFEAIYTIIEGLSDLKAAIKKSGPLTAYLCRESIDRSPNHRFRSLLKDFNHFLIEACQPNPKLANEIESKYNRLFDVITTSDREQRFSGRKQGQFLNVHYGDTIVTTNYDMIVEQYFWKQQKSFVDGFEQTQNPIIKSLRMDTFSENETAQWLIKLHGSIWMYRQKNSIFKTNVDPRNAVVPVDIEKEMLIFPSKEKPVLEYPYYDFYNVF
jgi:hypothetical protein